MSEDRGVMPDALIYYQIIENAACHLQRMAGPLAMRQPTSFPRILREMAWRLEHGGSLAGWEDAERKRENAADVATLYKEWLASHTQILALPVIGDIVVAQRPDRTIVKHAKIVEIGEATDAVSMGNHVHQVISMQEETGPNYARPYERKDIPASKVMDILSRNRMTPDDKPQYEIPPRVPPDLPTREIEDDYKADQTAADDDLLSDVMADLGEPVECRRCADRGYIRSVHIWEICPKCRNPKKLRSPVDLTDS